MGNHCLPFLLHGCIPDAAPTEQQRKCTCAAMSVIPLAGRTLYCPLKLRRRDPKVLGVRRLYEGGDISLFFFLDLGRLEYSLIYIFNK